MGRPRYDQAVIAGSIVTNMNASVCGTCGAVVDDRCLSDHDRSHGWGDPGPRPQPEPMNETDAAVHAWKGPGRYAIVPAEMFEEMDKVWFERHGDHAEVIPLYVGVPVPQPLIEVLRDYDPERGLTPPASSPTSPT